MMKVYFAGNKQIFADVNGYTVMTDQAQRAGGDGAYPEPFTIFLASLGTCAGIYAKSFCDQRGIDTEGMHLTQEQEFDPIRKIIGTVRINIYVNKDFPEKYDQAIISTVGLCAVKRHLREDIEVEVKVQRT
jgi:ribosomal protein S12 methylthiotransferase accessory factor